MGAVCGAIRLRLPPGRYYLAGTSPTFVIDPKPAKPPCRGAEAVEVVAGGTSRADILCPRR